MTHSFADEFPVIRARSARLTSGSWLGGDVCFVEVLLVTTAEVELLSAPRVELLAGAHASDTKTIAAA